MYPVWKKRWLAAAFWPINVFKPAEPPGGIRMPCGNGLSRVLYGVIPLSREAIACVLMAQAGARMSPVTSVIAAGIQNMP